MKLIFTNSQAVQIPNTTWGLLTYSLKGFKLCRFNVGMFKRCDVMTSKWVNLTLMALRQNKRKSKKGKVVKTTLYLEEELWKDPKWEAIQKKTTLSDLINKKPKELKELKKKTGIVVEEH